MLLIQNASDGSVFVENLVDADIQIRTVGPPQRDLLIGMYDRFDPLGAAFGLPPRRTEARRQWIDGALGQIVNVAAFSPAREVVGHCFLAADQLGSAELAIFVHQAFRGKGVGTALVKAALEWARAAGLRRVWSMTASDNRAALRLQQRCGFRLTKSISIEAELEIDLSAPSAARTMPQAAYIPTPGVNDDRGSTRFLPESGPALVASSSQSRSRDNGALLAEPGAGLYFDWAQTHRAICHMLKNARRRLIQRNFWSYWASTRSKRLERQG